jgi:hypothetical protein
MPQTTTAPGFVIGRSANDPRHVSPLLGETGMPSPARQEGLVAALTSQVCRYSDPACVRNRSRRIEFAANAVIAGFVSQSRSIHGPTFPTGAAVPRSSGWLDGADPGNGGPIAPGSRAGVTLTVAMSWQKRLHASACRPTAASAGSSGCRRRHAIVRVRREWLILTCRLC